MVSALRNLERSPGFFALCLLYRFVPSSTTAACHRWLFQFKLKLGKIEYRFKSSSSATPATFQELSRQVSLAAAVLLHTGHGTAPSQRKVLGPEADECGEETSEHL